jgi:hypothetical protein
MTPSAALKALLRKGAERVTLRLTYTRHGAKPVTRRLTVRVRS